MGPAYHKGVPLLGVHGITLDSWSSSEKKFLGSDIVRLRIHEMNNLLQNRIHTSLGRRWWWIGLSPVNQRNRVG